jgi:pSer/pThr/pTyr-binding forkhead associated (FHA) protein
MGRRAQPMTPGYPSTSSPGGNANPRTGMPTGQPGSGAGALQHPPSVPTGNSPVPMSAMGGASPTLFLIYNGQRYPVTKDQFIIGRGSKTSDLPIKDGNISRKHAAVIRRNGTFYIKDLGSTNGIDYKGMRIDNKRIDEGDVFHLCDYELRFTYRAD